jgi:hypothetical protein
MSEKEVTLASKTESQEATIDGEKKSGLTVKKAVIHAVIASPFLFSAVSSTYKNLSKSFSNISEDIKLVRQQKKNRDNAAANDEVELNELNDNERFAVLAQKNNLDEYDLCQREITYRKRARLYFAFFVILVGLVAGFAVTNTIGTVFSLPVLALTYVLCLRETYYVAIFKARSLLKFKPFLDGFMGYKSFLTAIESIPDVGDIFGKRMSTSDIQSLAEKGVVK